jgi:hypothetical protein
MSKPKITFEDYHQANECYQGICVACGSFEDCVEPDAEEYACSNCNEYQVYGMDQALMLELIDIVDDK